MTCKEMANEIDIQTMEASLHKLMGMDYTEASGSVIENGYLAFYHESGLYSVRHLKSGVISLVYAGNPYDAIKSSCNYT